MSSFNISGLMLLPQHRKKLEILVAAIAHHRVHGRFPTRSMVARFLSDVTGKKRNLDDVSRLVHTMDRWNVISVTTPVGERLPLIHVLSLGFDTLTDLLGYDPRTEGNSCPKMLPLEE